MNLDFRQMYSVLLNFLKCCQLWCWEECLAGFNLFSNSDNSSEKNFCDTTVISRPYDVHYSPKPPILNPLQPRPFRGVTNECRRLRKGPRTFCPTRESINKDGTLRKTSLTQISGPLSSEEWSFSCLSSILVITMAREKICSRYKNRHDIYGH